MTPSTYIKAQGLPSTAFVAEKVGKPVQTINNWFNHNFALFEVVVAGVKAQDEVAAYERGAQAVILQEVRAGNFIEDKP